MNVETKMLGDGACCFTVRAPFPAPSNAIAAALIAALVASTASLGVSTWQGVPVLLCFLCLWHLVRRLHVSEESLIAIEGIGLQLYTRRATGHETAQFIEIAAISAIFLTEAVRCDRCYYYLACLLHGNGREGEPRLVVPFRHLIPSLGSLQHICRGSTAVLWRGSEPASAL